MTDYGAVSASRALSSLSVTTQLNGKEVVTSVTKEKGSELRSSNYIPTKTHKPFLDLLNRKQHWSNQGQFYSRTATDNSHLETLGKL